MPKEHSGDHYSTLSKQNKAKDMTGTHDSLVYPMYMLLAVHSLQVVFLRKLYTKDHRVNRKHMWIWVVHCIVYPYILYKYWETMNDAFVNINEIYESRKIWVPMDCVLTLSVASYYFVAILYD